MQIRKVHKKVDDANMPEQVEYLKYPNYVLLKNISSSFMWIIHPLNYLSIYLSGSGFFVK